MFSTIITCNQKVCLTWLAIAHVFGSLIICSVQGVVLKSGAFQSLSIFINPVDKT